MHELAIKNIQITGVADQINGVFSRREGQRRVSKLLPIRQVDSIEARPDSMRTRYAH